MHGANPNLVCYGNRAPQGSFLDQAQKRWVEAKKSSPEDAVEWEQVVDALRTAGAETLEEQLRQGNYQGLPPEQVELVQGILGCSSEAAGLALVVCKGRLDIFEASAHYLPSPEEVVNLDMIRQHKWMDGLVLPGPDWVPPPETETTIAVESIIYPGIITGIDARAGTAGVFWPLASDLGMPERTKHRIGGPGPDGSPRYELVYAPYKRNYNWPSFPRLLRPCPVRVAWDQLRLLAKTDHPNFDLNPKIGTQLPASHKSSARFKQQGPSFPSTRVESGC